MKKLCRYSLFLNYIFYVLKIEIYIQIWFIKNLPNYKVIETAKETMEKATYKAL